MGILFYSAVVATGVVVWGRCRVFAPPIRLLTAPPSRAGRQLPRVARRAGLFFGRLASFHHNKRDQFHALVAENEALLRPYQEVADSVRNIASLRADVVGGGDGSQTVAELRKRA